MIASKAAAASSITYTELDYEAMLRRIERIFSLDNDTPEIAVANAEQLSPVAAAHRILTDSMSVLPIALRRKAGGERQELDTRPDLDYVLHCRMNDAMSPAMGKKILMSQAFWHGLGAAYIERDALGRVTGLYPLQTAGYQYMRDRDTGQSWYAFTVDDMTRKFQPGDLLLCFFETYDGKHGRGMLDLARETVATDRAARATNRPYQIRNAPAAAQPSGVHTYAAATVKHVPPAISSRSSRYSQSRIFSCFSIGSNPPLVLFR